MSDESKHPPKGSSGEHPVVVAFRAKMDSIQEHTVPAASELAERVARLTKPVPKGDGHPDPRREDDGEIPVDVVEPPPSAA